MRGKLEIDTGNGFKVLDSSSRIEISVDKKMMLGFSSAKKPKTRLELLDLLEGVMAMLRAPAAFDIELI